MNRNAVRLNVLLFLVMLGSSAFACGDGCYWKNVKNFGPLCICPQVKTANSQFTLADPAVEMFKRTPEVTPFPKCDPDNSKSPVCYPVKPTAKADGSDPMPLCRDLKKCPVAPPVAMPQVAGGPMPLCDPTGKNPHSPWCQPTINPPQCSWQGPVIRCPQEHPAVIADGSDPMPLCRHGHPNCPNLQINQHDNFFQLKEPIASGPWPWCEPGKPLHPECLPAVPKELYTLG